MGSFRKKRVAEQIQEEISSLLLRGLKDPRLGFITITGVEVTPDFRKAWVYFCTPGSEAEREQSLEGLQSAASYIRKTLGKRLRLKNIPEFEFKFDASLDEGNKIESLLSEVRSQEGWDDPTRLRGSAEEVALAIEAADNILVASHANPDGDAIGATLALGHILKRMNKQVTLYNQSPVPGNFMFLPLSDEISDDLSAAPFDCTVVLDCSELDRVGDLGSPEQLGVMVGVDHHLTTEPLGQYFYLDPGASSIGEMLFRIMKHLPVELDQQIGECIYTSLITDTGSFRYSNTSPEALRVAAEMVAVGVSPWEVALAVYESQPVERVQLLAKVLPTLEVDPSGKFGSITVTSEMFQQTGTNEEHIDGFINHPRGIEGVEVSIQFRQVEPERFKISFRSRGNVNVADIAARFGGGGHANAAGCSLPGDLSAVKAKIDGAVGQAIKDFFKS